MPTLTIELVPSTCWASNLRNLLPKATWDRIRKSSYAKFNHRCGICLAIGRLSCHEIWEYDDIHKIQKLVGFIALCDLCHYIKHIGFAGVQATKGVINFDDVIKHFMQVNDCSKEEFEKQKVIAFRQWEERSRYAWTLNLDNYKDELESFVKLK